MITTPAAEWGVALGPELSWEELSESLGRTSGWGGGSHLPDAETEAERS